MGVGTPEDLVEGVAQGVDMFDCVMPTRNARNGTLFTRFGDLKIRTARHKTDLRPLDETCTCHACAGSSGVAYADGGRYGLSRKVTVACPSFSLCNQRNTESTVTVSIRSEKRFSLG